MNTSISLLQQIKDATVDPTFKTADVLRLCKILANRLNHQAFKEWVDKEVNGYKREDELPDYRILKNLSCRGDFFGSFGSGVRNALIPLANIPKDFRESASLRYVRNSASALENDVNQANQNNISIMRSIWPADLVVRLNYIVYEYMVCGEAWTDIPTSAFVAILDTIKNRILDFVLAIEAEVAEVGEVDISKEAVSEKVINYIFNQCILHENNQTAFSGSIIQAHNQGVNMSETNPIKIQAGRDVSSNVISSEVSGVVAGGDISGSVSNTISQLRTADTPEASELADKLVQLQAVIENEPSLSIEDKNDALIQVKALAEAGQNPQEGTMQQVAKGAIRMLKGLSTELPTATAIFHEINHLLPEIAHLFGL